MQIIRFIDQQSRMATLPGLTLAQSKAAAYAFIVDKFDNETSDTALLPYLFGFVRLYLELDYPSDLAVPDHGKKINRLLKRMLTDDGRENLTKRLINYVLIFRGKTLIRLGKF